MAKRSRAVIAGVGFRATTGAGITIAENAIGLGWRVRVQRSRKIEQGTGNGGWCGRSCEGVFADIIADAGGCTRSDSECQKCGKSNLAHRKFHAFSPDSDETDA